jgi:hypothetical protein
MVNVEDITEVWRPPHVSTVALTTQVTWSGCAVDASNYVSNVVSLQTAADPYECFGTQGYAPPKYRSSHTLFNVAVPPRFLVERR